MSYRIISDTCCDLWQDFYKELNVDVTPLAVTFKGQTLSEYDEAWLKDFYTGLRDGEVATTAAVNPEGWKEVIRPALENGEDALVLAFSSGLSTTYQSAVIAAQELKEEFPRQDVIVIDTLSASMGQGLLLWYACKKRDEGASLTECAAWCENNKLHLSHWFTVDDLMFLKRGGRVSAATALVGTMLKIKPVMHMDDEGHLIKVGTARGKKAALDAMAKQFTETGLPGQNDTVFISHGDCIEDVEYLKGKLLALGVKNVITYYVGAVIGSHSGPGTVALFFLASHR